jgi:hypothetical protein
MGQAQDQIGLGKYINNMDEQELQNKITRLENDIILLKKDAKDFKQMKAYLWRQNIIPRL